MSLFNQAKVVDKFENSKAEFNFLTNSGFFLLAEESLRDLATGTPCPAVKQLIQAVDNYHKFLLPPFL